MTLQEAYDNYEIEVEEKKERHKNRIKKSMIIWSIVGSIAIIIFIILLDFAYNIPLEKSIFGEKWERTFGAQMLIFVSWGAIGFIPILLLIGLISTFISIKKGPKSFLEENRNLYMNCLTADDVNEKGKLYYRQKLEELRHLELLRAIRSAGNAAAAAASTAMMYHMIDRD